MATSSIDLNALKAELASLSTEDLQKQLLEVRTRQKVQQLKHSNTASQKAYREKRAASVKLMTEQAKAAPATLPGFKNLYEQIQAAAKAKASEIVGVEELADSDTLENEPENENAAEVGV